MPWCICRINKLGLTKDKSWKQFFCLLLYGPCLHYVGWRKIEKYSLTSQQKK